MAIDPKSGKQITLQEAKDLIKAFETKFPNQIKASFVGIDTLNLILNQENVMGVRIYYGYNTDSKIISPVLVGVDNDGEDITAIVIDRGVPCPPICSVSSPLSN